MEKKYFIGLDIGTNSVGYAVTDTNYNVLRIKGKKAWGVRLFDEANSAEQRRGKRTARRRLDRRKLRIMWLNEIFAPQLEKVDPIFLSRLKYSSLYLEDKKYMNNLLTSKDSLFHDVNGQTYTDKDYFHEYPTIYHLRSSLVTKPAKDVRFLYLAIHNIVKRRGHFLYDTDYGENIEVKSLINNFLDNIGEMSSDELIKFNITKLDDRSESDLLQCLKDRLGIKDTKQKFAEIFEPKDKVSKKLIDVFVDGKITLKDFFDIEEGDIKKFSFDDENYEDVVYPSLCNMLSEEQLKFIDDLHQIYSTLQLKKILGDKNYICEAMVDLYEKHSRQLKMFKNFIKRFYPHSYYNMFRNPSGKFENKSFTNYALYVKGSIFDGKKQIIGIDNSDRKKESFYKYVKNILEQEPENIIDINSYNNQKQEILLCIENDDFLPKQRTSENGLFPNKLYEKELRKILEVNSQKYTFLNAKDEFGISNKEKIIKILNFKIPYFVGPIGKKDNKFGWAIRKDFDGKMYPWTLDKMIDFDASEDAFIRKMTNKCTYLFDQDVLPKNSILYSKFRVLNELNKLRINGDAISVELKQNIFNNLFKKNKKVSISKLKEYLLCEGLYTKQEIQTMEISGIDKNFANDFSSYFVLSSILGEDFVENNLDTVEKIILYHTIISDKNRLEKRLDREFGKILTNDKIKKLKSLSFSDWGRFSKLFLEDLKFVNTSTGELTSIIDELYNTNQNLQEILNNKSYTLYKSLEEYNDKLSKDITYEDVENLYCSPQVKRGVWQSIKIVNEIIALIGCQPEKVFVEVTRHDEEKGEKGRKSARFDNLYSSYTSKDFQNAVRDINIDINTLLSELDKRADDKNSLRSEKLYLYFLQLGKCAYSGEPIDIQMLYDEHSYDVDHIIPQSIIKDDSIDNKVLVKRECNKAKNDTYPLYPQFANWVNKQIPFWQTLLKLNLMSERKYARLVRKEQLSDDELGQFVARQLVETNQASKAVIELLKRIVDNPRKIVYSKAGFVSEFRNKYDITKCRDINDFHHAKDAYLNIVVGNVLFNRFTDDPRRFYSKNNKNSGLTKNIKNLFDNVVYNLNTDEVVWNGEKDCIKVKNICQRNDCLISRMSYTKMDGNFYDETLYKSTNNDPNTKAKISLKGNLNNPLSNFEKYGGFNNATVSYFMLVESQDKKGNKKKTLESVPAYILARYKNSADRDNKVLEYLVSTQKLINPKILLNKINIKSTIKVGEGEYLIAGKTGDRYILHNANQWYLSSKLTKYVKTCIIKYTELKMQKRTGELTEQDRKVILSPASKEGNKEIALREEDNIELYNAIISQLEKPIYKGLALENIVLILKNGYESFVSLNILEQADVLFNLIKRVSAGSNTADLKIVGGSTNTGKIMINKDITNANLTLIIRSATGLFEKRIKL